MLTGKKIGLALGGGAALGAAHIGVLKAIEELGIEISFISGTSIGAFVASFYANGKNSDEIQAITNDLEWLDISGFTLSKFGLLSNEKLGKLISKHLGDLDFNSAKIPLAMIATDIKTGEKITLKEGKIAQAAMASTCIPGVFIPLQIGDRWLVDGGIVENVPLSPLKQMGAEYIIAVDLNTNQTFRKPENIIEVLLNSFHFTLNATSKLQSAQAELLIAPDLCDFNRIDIDQADTLIIAGYDAAMKAFKPLLDMSDD